MDLDLEADNDNWVRYPSKERNFVRKNMTKWYTIELGTLDVTFSSIDTFST